MNITSIASLMTGLVVSSSALAHHSNAMFDQAKPMIITGEVVRWEWTNPHTWLYVAVSDPKEGKVEWALEGGSPGVLRRTGWSKEAVKPGDKITVNFSPAKDGTKSGLFGGRVTRADGTTIGGTPEQ